MEVDNLEEKKRVNYENISMSNAQLIGKKNYSSKKEIEVNKILKIFFQKKKLNKLLLHKIINFCSKKITKKLNKINIKNITETYYVLYNCHRTFYSY